MPRLRLAIAAAGLTAATALLIIPVAAQAASSATIKTFLPNLSVAPGASAQNDVEIFGSGTVHHVTLTYDLSGLPAHVTFDDPKSIYNCDRQGDLLSCQLLEDTLDLDTTASDMQISLSADGSAVAGDNGSLRMTIDSDETDPTTLTADVSVAEGVNLTAGPTITASAGVGTHVSAPITVSNSGTTTAHGVVLFMYGDEAVQSATRYSNCTYAGNEISDVYCVFDTDLEPGKTYGISTPLDFQVSADSQAPTTFAIDLQWLTPDDWAADKARLEFLGLDQDGQQGTASALTLVAQASTSTRTNIASQTDTDPTDNHSDVAVHITGTNDADYQAIGATVHGTAGETVTIKVGLKNHGPAAIRRGRAGDPTYSVDVTFPNGVTVTAVQPDCVPFVDGKPANVDDGTPGYHEYRCFGTAKVAVGDVVLVPFSFQLDNDLSDATASIEIGQPTSSGEKDGWDHNLANNTADIVINPSGDSGSLPVTGSNAISIGGAGLAAVALGVLLFWVGRRRRRATI